MKRISEFFIDKAGLKLFIAALLVYIAFAGGVMNSGAKYMSQLSGTEVEILDLQMTGYNMDSVNSILSKYSPEARRFSVKFSLIADSVYPVVYTFLFIVILTWVMKSGNHGTMLSRYLHLVPLLTFFVDYAENAAIVSVVSSFPEQTLGQVQLASTLTITKWLSIVVQILVLAAALAKLVANRLHNRNTE
jgi:hypothetical protein